MTEKAIHEALREFIQKIADAGILINDVRVHYIDTHNVEGSTAIVAQLHISTTTR